jgi:hypothetical protein
VTLDIVLRTINPPSVSLQCGATFCEIGPFRPRPTGTHVPRPRPGTHWAAATPPAAHSDARCPVAPSTARAPPFCGPFRRLSDLSPGLHCSKARGYFPGTMCLGSLDRGRSLTSWGIRAPTLEFRACGTVAVFQVSITPFKVSSLNPLPRRMRRMRQQVTQVTTRTHHGACMRRTREAKTHGRRHWHYVLWGNFVMTKNSKPPMKRDSLYKPIVRTKKRLNPSGEE